MMVLLVRVSDRQYAVVGDQIASILQVAPGIPHLQMLDRTLPVTDLAAALQLPHSDTAGTVLLCADGMAAFACDAVSEMIEVPDTAAFQPFPSLLRAAGYSPYLWGMLNMWLLRQEEAVTPVLTLARG